MPKNYYRFELVPLPYDYSALEPYIDTETMQLHHDKHLGAYVDKLNAALEGYPRLQSLSLEQLLQNQRMLPPVVRRDIVNNGGGVYNHNFFFEVLRPPIENNRPFGQLEFNIDRIYGTFEEFKERFKEMALDVFGSGYLWLVLNRRGVLELMPTANQDTPIAYRYKPIITIDVWEHAYYLKYQNRRGEYIDNYWNVVNWQKAEENLVQTDRK